MRLRNLFVLVSMAFVLLVTVAVQGSVRASTQKRTKQPNILFAISDDQSYPYASAYGSKAVNTPAFDRVAREGVLFRNGFVASPGCSPSRAAFLTGRYPWQIRHAGTHASSFPRDLVAFPDLLERANYFIGFTGKGWSPGNWQVSGRERNPAGPEFDAAKLKPPVSGIHATDYAANFKLFLDQRPAGKPFYFWYGGHEPHRVFEKGVGLKSGKRLEDVYVPPFLPDTPEVRSDLLDYAVEIEWFDSHLRRMLEMLEATGELDNTIVIVASDNGMAFPRAKANCYEYGIHVPLAVRWGAGATGNRVVDDVVSLVDLTPTILEAAGVPQSSYKGLSGRSIMNILKAKQGGLVDSARDAIYAARERHSSARYNNLGYPQRAIRTNDFLFIRNLKPELYPAGDPQKYEANGELGAMHDAYHDIDPAPTLDLLVAQRDEPRINRFFHLAVDKRPAEELYDIRRDPGCLNNLVDNRAYADVRRRLRAQLNRYLARTNDPRLTGDGEVFETYKRYSPIRKFPPPGGAARQTSK